MLYYSGSPVTFSPQDLQDKTREQIFEILQNSGKNVIDQQDPVIELSSEESSDSLVTKWTWPLYTTRCSLPGPLAQSFGAFWSSLIRHSPEDILFSVLHKQVLKWVLVLSNLEQRSPRHTSLIISCSIVDAVMGLIIQLQNAVAKHYSLKSKSSNTRRRSKRSRSGSSTSSSSRSPLDGSDAGSGSDDSLNSQENDAASQELLSQLKNSIITLNEIIDSYLKQILVFRFCDSFPHFRKYSLDKLTEWISLSPTIWFKDKNLRYYGWMANNDSPMIRRSILKNVISIFSLECPSDPHIRKVFWDGKSLSQLLCSFAMQFSNRFVEIALWDKDVQCRKFAISLLLKISQLSMQAQLETDDLTENLNDNSELGDTADLPLASDAASTMSKKQTLFPSLPKFFTNEDDIEELYQQLMNPDPSLAKLYTELFLQFEFWPIFKRNWSLDIETATLESLNTSTIKPFSSYIDTIPFDLGEEQDPSSNLNFETVGTSLYWSLFSKIDNISQIISPLHEDISTDPTTRNDPLELSHSALLYGHKLSTLYAVSTISKNVAILLSQQKQKSPSFPLLAIYCSSHPSSRAFEMFFAFLGFPLPPEFVKSIPSFLKSDLATVSSHKTMGIHSADGFKKLPFSLESRLSSFRPFSSIFYDTTTKNKGKKSTTSFNKLFDSDFIYSHLPDLIDSFSVNYSSWRDNLVNCFSNSSLTSIKSRTSYFVTRTCLCDPTTMFSIISLLFSTSTTTTKKKLTSPLGTPLGSSLIEIINSLSELDHSNRFTISALFNLLPFIHQVIDVPLQNPTNKTKTKKPKTKKQKSISGIWAVIISQVKQLIENLTNTVFSATAGSTSQISYTTLDAQYTLLSFFHSFSDLYSQLNITSEDTEQEPLSLPSPAPFFRLVFDSSEELKKRILSLKIVQLLSMIDLSSSSSIDIHGPSSFIACKQLILALGQILTTLTVKDTQPALVDLLTSQMDMKNVPNYLENTTSRISPKKVSGSTSLSPSPIESEEEEESQAYPLFPQQLQFTAFSILNQVMFQLNIIQAFETSNETHSDSDSDSFSSQDHSLNLNIDDTTTSIRETISIPRSRPFFESLGQFLSTSFISLDPSPEFIIKRSFASKTLSLTCSISPSHLSSSLFSCIFHNVSSFILPSSFLPKYLYYIVWNSKELNRCLKNVFDFEIVQSDSNSISWEFPVSAIISSFIPYVNHYHALSSEQIGFAGSSDDTSSDAEGFPRSGSIFEKLTEKQLISISVRTARLSFAIYKILKSHRKFRNSKSNKSKLTKLVKNIVDRLLFWFTRQIQKHNLTIFILVGITPLLSLLPIKSGIDILQKYQLEDNIQSLGQMTYDFQTKYPNSDSTIALCIHNGILNLGDRLNISIYSSSSNQKGTTKVTKVSVSDEESDDEDMPPPSFLV